MDDPEAEDSDPQKDHTQPQEFYQDALGNVYEHADISSRQKLVIRT